ncbi:MAG: PaaI family thioesterase [Candidatus Thiodiazotropha sp. (ex Gloverina cf. vestifex)]|nr:PaaI family thioesterase [Candidatus Thiodiazotropha sp. (ex Gloverina cf. vestifex)]
MTEKRPDSAARRLEHFPPFQLLGIRVLELDEKWRKVRILLPLNADNRNPGGSMFGGSIASLADPIPALACHGSFPQFAVWTRELQVDFRSPGLSDLELRFELTEAAVGAIAEELTKRGRSTPSFEFGFYDQEDNLVAWVKNRVALRPQGASTRTVGAVPRKR